MSIILSIIYFLLIVIIIYSILKERRDASETLAWILICVMVPVVGIVGYMLFGRSYRRSQEFKYKDYDPDKTIEKICKEQLEAIDQSDKDHADFMQHADFMKLLINNGHAPLCVHNELKILNNGNECFPLMFKDLSEAKEYIHLEVFGLESGLLFERLLAILTERVQAGVKVRIIYDSVGSRALKYKDVRRLAQTGIEAYSYMPMWLPQFASKFNYRNHRKITVIDGVIAYTGGMNIADRYLKGTKRGIWRDTHIRIVGEAVSLLNATFLKDWAFVTKGQILSKEEVFRPIPSSLSSAILPIQIATSGPDSPYASIMQAYFAAIGKAKKYIYISTPYLLPNQAIVTALRVAALSGVDVRVLIPVRGDNIMVAWAGYSNIDKLLEANVAVYLYKKGFNHSKYFVIDDQLCSIGSANLDYRSFDIDFEVQAIIYDKTTSKELRSHFLNDISEAELITAQNWEKRPRISKIMEPIARLFGFLF